MERIEVEKVCKKIINDDKRDKNLGYKLLKVINNQLWVDC